MLNNIINKLKLSRRSFLNKRKISRLVRDLKKASARKRIFLFQTPSHSNIGDHAIAEAQLEFFAVHFPDAQIIEINQSVMQDFILHYGILVRPYDLITLHGGGNFGNEYLYEENLRRMVVENFPKNKIVVFPQTIHYSKDESGQNELKKTQAIFNEHSYLTLTAREKVSFELMKEYFPKNKVILTPDIVLFTSQIKSSARTYALEVIRQDQESILSEDDKRNITGILRSNFGKVISSDMHVMGFKSVKTIEERQKILENKYSQFRSANIAITDRLHGMVLAVITGTPCIVFSNYNQKVLGTYEWIKDLEYIRYVKNIEEAKVAFAELKNLSDFKVYDNVRLREEYKPLIEALNEK